MDIAEFENLFVLSKPALERFVYFRMPSKSDADDIIQEAAVSAYMNMHAINNPESFKAWILKIAANKCNDFYRKLAKRYEIPLDEITENVVSKNQYGISTKEVVRETLNGLMNKDKQILFLYYFKNKPQAEIAKLLNIPVGTVKSRLHTAKQNFKQNYPFPPKLKGETQMKTLPDIMPEYKITQSKKAPFEVRCEELMGWSIIPKLGEKLTWAIYDYPERKRSETTKMEVNGRAEVHGIEGVEIIAVEEDPKDFNATDGSRSVERRFVAQLTDTHCRFLAESHVENGVRKYFTFLDGDEFHPNWGFGEDNCGKEVNLTQKGTIVRNGNEITCPKDLRVMDVVGRYNVDIAGKSYDTICVIDVQLYNPGVFSEQFIDKNGRTVLWRRFNINDWKIKRYNEHYGYKDKLWSEMFPNNERVTVNGELYVHWYDCLTDYIF